MESNDFKDALQSVFGPEELDRGNQQMERKEKALAVLERAVARCQLGLNQRSSSAIREADALVNAMAKESLDEARRALHLAGPTRANERYLVLRCSDDRGQLLARLAQTLDFVEAKIKIDTPERVSKMYEMAAEGLAKRLSQVEQVEVGLARLEEVVEPESSEEDEPHRYLAALAAEATERLSKMAFSACDDSELLDTAEGEASVLRSSFFAWSGAAAAGIAGECLALPDLPEAPQVRCEAVWQRVQVYQLLVEVRKLFETYQRIVRDGGLMSAFGSGSGQGSCSGYNLESPFFDDDSLLTVYMGDDPRLRGGASEIPEPYEGMPGAMSPEETIAFLRGLDLPVYHGFIEESPVEWVDAFWLGLKRLLTFADGVVRADVGAWNDYLDEVRTRVADAADAFTSRMDGLQFDTYIGDLHDLIETDE